jgi:hypothetical protein
MAQTVSVYYRRSRENRRFAFFLNAEPLQSSTPRPANSRR